METESSLSSKKIYVSLEPVPEPRIYKYLENGREVLDEKETEEKKLFSAAQRINFHETTEEEEDQRWSWETFEKNKKKAEYELKLMIDLIDLVNEDRHMKLVESIKPPLPLKEISRNLAACYSAKRREFKRASDLLKTTSTHLAERISSEDTYCRKSMQLRKSKWRVTGSYMSGYPVFYIDTMFSLKEGRQAPLLITKNSVGEVSLKLTQTLTNKKLAFCSVNERDGPKIQLVPTYDIQTTDDLSVEGIDNVNKLLNISRMASIDELCFMMLRNAAVSLGDDTILINPKSIQFKINSINDYYCIKLLETDIDEKDQKSTKKRSNTEDMSPEIVIPKSFNDSMTSCLTQVKIHQLVSHRMHQIYKNRSKWSMLTLREMSDSNLLKRIRNSIYHIKRCEEYLNVIEGLVEKIRTKIDPKASVRWISTRNSSVASFNLYVRDLNINGVIREGKLYVNSSYPIENSLEAENWIMAKVLRKFGNHVLSV